MPTQTDLIKALRAKIEEWRERTTKDEEIHPASPVRWLDEYLDGYESALVDVARDGD